MRMKKLLIIFLLMLAKEARADDSFSLPGDGKWYKLCTMGGTHAHVEYIYYHTTGNNPSIATGQFDFINSQNFMVQHHQSMGYQAWNQIQFALINFGGTSEVWIRATTGVDAGTFTVTRNLNATLNLGATYDTELNDNGGTVTIYEKLKDNADTYYSDVIIPSNSLTIGTGNVDPVYKLAVKGKIHAQEII